jgi:hypothetical protein
MFRFLDKDKDKEKNGSHGKTATEMYIFQRLAMFVLADGVEVDDEEQKNMILHPFNKKAKASNYVIISKDFVLPRMLKEYLGVVQNTWSTAVKKLKEAGLIYLSERELVHNNCIFIIIPPVVPTLALVNEWATIDIDKE